MKIVNILYSAFLIILIFIIYYLKHEYDIIEVDPSGDGQAGIGKGVVGLMLMGLTVLPIIASVILGLFQLGKPVGRSIHSNINMIASILISLVAYMYLFE